MPDEDKLYFCDAELIMAHHNIADAPRSGEARVVRRHGSSDRRDQGFLALRAEVRSQSRQPVPRGLVRRLRFAALAMAHYYDGFFYSI